MARARLLKPGFFTNDRLAELSPVTRILFAGLWTIADREGRLEDRPARIKAEVLPYDKGNVDRMLTELAGSGFIERYESGGHRYIQVLAFARHQSPHVREPASLIPAPGEHGASTSPARGETGTGPADPDPDPDPDPDSVAEAEAEAEACDPGQGPDVAACPAAAAAAGMPAEPDEAYGRMARAFSAAGIELSRMQYGRLEGWAEDVPPEWVEYACQEASDLNRRSFRYVERVLDDVRQRGGPEAEPEPELDDFEARKRRYLGGAIGPVASVTP